MSQPLDFFKYDQSELSCEGKSLVEIAETVSTPVYVYSLQGFMTSFQEFKQGLAREGLEAKICFAVKANPNLSLLRALVSEGAGLDLVSGGELHRAAELRVPGTHVVFSGVGKTELEMEQALAYEGGLGIGSFNVESESELKRLNEVAGRLGKKARVSLRVNPDVDAKTHPYISTGLRHNKFGIQPRDVLGLVKGWKQFSHLRLAGLSVHIGSQILSLAPLKEAFEKLADLILKFEPLLTEPLEFVDLGGGLGVEYALKSKPSRLSISSYCQLIGRTFGARSKFVRKRGRPLAVMLEPGRRIAANAGVLLTRILYIKKHHGKTFVIVDAGMNDLMRPALYQSRHEIVPCLKKGGTKKLRCDIVGPVCESSDAFLKGALLPANIREGDLLAILSAGAYGHSMSSQYNCRPRPPEVLVESNQFRVIRRRETYSEMLAQETD